MKAITIGSGTVDVIVAVADADIERMTLHNNTASFLLLEPGRKVDASSIVTRTGGGAVNAAISLKRQGFDAAALLKLGTDHNREKIVARLREEGIATNLIRMCETESTAVSVMIASHDRNAAIFTHRGANGFLDDDDLPPAIFAGVDLVYVTNLSNRSADCFPNIVARADEAGAFVAANPGVRQLKRKTAPFFDSLRRVDALTLNLEEARALLPALMERTGWERRCDRRTSPMEPVLEVEGFRLAVESFFERLHALGPHWVTITDGVKGAHLSESGKYHFQPAFPAEVVNTVGAGDAFASTLAGCLVRGDATAAAARLAARNAASVIGHIDAQSGLMFLARPKEDGSIWQVATSGSRTE